MEWISDANVLSMADIFVALSAPSAKGGLSELYTVQRVESLGLLDNCSHHSLIVRSVIPLISCVLDERVWVILPRKFFFSRIVATVFRASSAF